MNIYEVFAAYCGSGRSDLDNKGFVKLCKDCGFLDKRCTSTDVDLIFTKVVGKGSRRIDIDQFVVALELVSDKKGIDVMQLLHVVQSSAGPVLSGTQADAVRFHDDKNTYTGVHVHGGPDTGIRGVGTTTQLASASMGRGHSAGTAAVSASLSHHGVSRGYPPTEPPAAVVPSAAAVLSSAVVHPSAAVASEPVVGRMLGPLPPPVAPIDFVDTSRSVAASPASARSSTAGAPDPLSRVFFEFGGASGGLDGKSFLKLCKDCELVDKSFTSADVDLIFAKSVPKGQRRLNVVQLEAALVMVAQRISFAGHCKAMRHGFLQIQGNV
eukprot:gnl/TRDRNA2_/TRDRNA2_28786_c0_seq1.p1 gnl/TRDRNA2_/TRDRNA2_28786_c0~~gnl/TRDRNA2_/TRDRNA2_28786_c0_seq1.p1  ORF type:complete len:325 (+),score=52.30 gnl/TRDRNA2_/TRDRNA2_28786_c0_seq1:126-1100(+)